ncbi:MAG: phospholipid carrier-dependent glycosyltransferase, partial [SAR324 cluster bacterium]|nr:phospholipid carrier-dependent glycosyltransferase [SAR324 cluster bacterium]
MLSRLYSQAFLALLVLLVCLLLPGLGSVSLIDWDENIYSEAAKQMLQTGNWLDVVLNGQPLGEKPPLFIWLQALSFWGLGISEFSARLPSVVTAVVLLGFCYSYGRWLVSRNVGILWAVLFLTALLPSIHARSAVMEHVFNAFIGMGAFLLFRYDWEQRHSPPDVAPGASVATRPLFWLS